MNDMLKNFGIDQNVSAFCEEVLQGLKPRFEKIDEVAEYNHYKVLAAMQKNKVSAACLTCRQTISVSLCTRRTSWQRGLPKPHYSLKARSSVGRFPYR